LNKNYSFGMEFQKLFLEWIRKQGGTVVLLSLAIIALYHDFVSRTNEMKITIINQDKKIEAQIDEIRRCEMERTRLESRVEWLVNELSARFPKLKRMQQE